MRTALVLDALEQALWTRQRDGKRDLAGLVHHTDAGSQYTSIAFTERLAAAGVSASVGTVGDAYDNALAESVIGLFKTELIKPCGPWRTTEQVEIATLDYVDWFNNRRLYEACGDIPPAELEDAYYRQNNHLADQLTTNRVSELAGAVQSALSVKAGQPHTPAYAGNGAGRPRIAEARSRSRSQFCSTEHVDQARDCVGTFGKCDLVAPAAAVGEPGGGEILFAQGGHARKYKPLGNGHTPRCERSIPSALRACWTKRSGGSSPTWPTTRVAS